MDWTDYIASVVKLVDLHDSNHQPGTSPPPPSEDRPGLGNGLWLDIAVRLIDFLHEYDAEVNEDWVYLGEFIDEMHERHGIMEDDVQYVVSYLATPTRLRTVAEGDDGQPTGVRSTKKTALVERPRHQVADRCRLTHEGRQTLQVAKMSNNWLYTRHDAQKIRTAIMTDDFAAIIPQAASVSQAVRSFSHEITRLLERTGEQDVWETYRKRVDDYASAIDDVGQAVIEASHMFWTREVQDRFEAWQERQTREDVSSGQIRRALNELMQASTKLRRKFADLLHELASQQRTVIGNVRFDKAAILAVFQPPEDRHFDLFLAALGPWTDTVSLPAPEDLVGVLKPVLDEENTETLEFGSEAEQALPGVIDRFLARYGHEIKEALRDGGVSLSEAVRKGWVQLDGGMALTELVGVYTSPEWLGEAGRHIGIGFRRDGLDVELPDGSKLYGDELIMFLMS